jgi:hypothetical protein
MIPEGNAAHPVGCDSPLQIVMAVCRIIIVSRGLCAMQPIRSVVTLWQPSAESNGSLSPFLFKFKLAGSGVTALC